MQIQPYLNFNGNCAEAFRFYEKVLGGKIEAMMTHKEMPPGSPVSPGWEDKILHARLSMGGDAVIMGSDVPPQYQTKPQGFAVSVQLADEGEADRIFAALAEKGTTTMPIQKTFWAKRFGMCTDRFGTPWMINCSEAA